MKKSRIILPAIALLAVSGIASVTGTVAWFTASNSASVNLGNIAAISTDGSLKGVITAKKGTKEYKANDNSNKTLANTVSSVNFEYLTDVSYDITQPKFFDAISDVVTGTDEEGNPTQEVTQVEYIEVSNKKVSTIKTGTAESPVINDVWYAAEFSVEFSTEATYGEYDLFFDAREAYSSITENGSAEIAKALRIGMSCGAEKFVWAPTNQGTEITRVTTAGKTSGENATGATASYAAGNALIGSSTEHFTASSTQSEAITDVTHLASGLTSTSTKTVDFVVWFEGTDDACVSTYASNIGTTVTSMAAKLSFYAVSWTQA